MSQPTTAGTNNSSTPRTAEEYLNSLAGRDSILQDSYTSIPPASSIAISTNAKFVPGKGFSDNETHHMIFCTHCSRGKWKVF